MSHRLELKHVASKFGRLAQKPQKEDTDAIHDDDTPVPIQDQIEGLRTKISLKERYNKVILQDVKESKLGANSNLHQAFNETRELRGRLIDAIESEKDAVQHSLRLYRAYQLALTDKSSKDAIPWLKDKLFDMTKKYMAQLFRLSQKRKKLDYSETQVAYIEKMPIPGSLGWEKEMTKEFIDLDNKIEIAKAKGKTAQLLYSTYVSLKYILQEESGKYYSILKLFENQCRIQLSEFQGLQKVLREAKKFREDADNELRDTEIEFSENRRYRKKQMGRIKRAVENEFSEIENISNKNKPKSAKRSLGFMKMGKSEINVEKIRADELKNKVEKINEVREKLRSVLSIMRIDDVKLVPVRLRTVEHLSELLTKERKAKISLQDRLLFQKAQLYLIQCNLVYTGDVQEELFRKKKAALQVVVERKKNEILTIRSKLEDMGKIFTTLRFSGIFILNSIDQNDIDQDRAASSCNLKAQLKLLYAKLSRMSRKLHALKRMFPTEDEEKTNRALHLLRTDVIPPQYVRVGSPNDSQSDVGDSEDDDFIDSKVPNRKEIKSQGQILVRQAIIAKGLR